MASTPLDVFLLFAAAEMAEQMQAFFTYWLRPGGRVPEAVFQGAALLVDSSGSNRGRICDLAPLQWPAELLRRPLVIIASGGGLDSTAAAIIARQRFPKAMLLLVRSDTGFEPEDSHTILQATAKHVQAGIITIQPEEDLYQLIRGYGRLPNRLTSPWCSQNLKGFNLDACSWWLSETRKLRSTVHTAGLLAEEKKRGQTHLKKSLERFGDQVEEVLVLADAGTTKPQALAIVETAGLPMSDTYKVRGRHGCIPCRWWNEPQWRDFYRLDAAGYEAAAQLEDDCATLGKQNTEDNRPAGFIFPKRSRVWLLGDDATAAKRAGFLGRREPRIDATTGRQKVKAGKPQWISWSPRAVQFPDGLTLREWLVQWDREQLGWRRRGRESDNLVLSCSKKSAEEEAEDGESS